MGKVNLKKIVREGYARIAKQNSSCGCSVTSCCGSSAPVEISKGIGYTDENLKEIPEGANLGLGCGNPVAFATLKKGETVLDLGSGAGIDCFLAASRVGKAGKVIGVDMTPEMIDRARQNVSKSKYKNIEFRLGEIENLPVAERSVNAVISNCVINLVPDKEKAFKEIFRVLKTGGRMLISDIVLTKNLPLAIRKSVAAYVGCISGALLKKDYLQAIKNAGFKDIKIMEETEFPMEFMSNDPSAVKIAKSLKVSAEKLKELASSVLSIKVYAKK